jgi:DNA processing protein
MTTPDQDGAAVILALSALGKIGPVRTKVLLTQAARPTDILNWSIDQFQEIPGLSTVLASHIKDHLDVAYGREVMAWAEKHQYGLITMLDADFPAALRSLYDAPPFLFVKGVMAEADAKAIAIVGSRSASDYGKSTAFHLAEELSRHGVTIVSGMALGVDSAAHRGALEAGGRTVAVLGSGIDVVYPPQNKALYNEIAEHGAVLSEFLPGVEPTPGHFPRRNRVIAGLSQAVVVVEAGEKSGALLTADLALSQGKKLFAVPGSVSSRLSAGTHALIKAGAHLLTSVDDIFSVLPQMRNDYIAPKKREEVDLTEAEHRLMQHLSETPKQLDTLMRECGFSVTDAASYLLSLELRGLVKQLSGKRFITV